MPFTLANTERGTIAIPCPKCHTLLEASLDKFTPQTDYRYGVRCSACHVAFTVQIEPEPESQLTPVAADALCDYAGEQYAYQCADCPNVSCKIARR